MFGELREEHISRPRPVIVIQVLLAVSFSCVGFHVLWVGASLHPVWNVSPGRPNGEVAHGGFYS